MKGYLFDTNIWSHWFEQRPYIIEEINRLDPQSTIYLSSVVWGEAIFGAKANKKFSFDKYAEFIFSKKPIIMPIDESVAAEFGELKAKLFEKKSPTNVRTNAGRIEMLKKPLPAKSMGVDENDLWIVSQALAYNLVLVTNDRMNNLLEVVPNRLEYKIWK